MEMAHPWKSAKSADFHRRLEMPRPKAARLSHISTGPAGNLSLWRAPEKPAAVEKHRRIGSDQE
jgi:hypothetical protein